MPKDYYNVLGVAKDATHDEIKRAFRKKAHEFHPDKAGGDEQKFKDVNEAYQILGNEDKRKQYDQFGESAFQGQGFAGTGMNWNDFMKQAGFAGGGFGGSRNGGFGINFEDLGDIMGDMFGFGPRSRARGYRVRQGEDIEIEMTIDFMDSVTGVEKTIRLDHIVKCDRCNGNGAEPGTKISSCPNCGGTGVVTHTQSTILGTFQTQTTCRECGGEGKHAEEPCEKCGGDGRIQKKDDVTIKIPAGIDNGQRVRMTGLGNAGLSGGAAGDLYIYVRIKEDKRFEREGDNIKSEAKISISQAVLGDTIEIETVYGLVKLKIPSGTTSGKVFKLRNKGMQIVGGSGKGDHLVKVQIDIPSKLSRKEKKLFEELREEEVKSRWF